MSSRKSVVLDTGLSRRASRRLTSDVIAPNMAPRKSRATLGNASRRMSLWMSMYGDVEWEARALGSCKELTLFCNEMDDGYMWDVVNRSRLLATVEADFSGSENIKVMVDDKEVNTQTLVTEIWPLQRKRVGHVLAKDLTKEFSVECRWKQTLSECPVDVLQAMLELQEGDIEKMLNEARPHFEKISADAYTFSSLQKMCEDAQCQFIDFRFPPVPLSICSDDKIAKRLRRPIQWRRPDEFLAALAPAIDPSSPISHGSIGALSSRTSSATLCRGSVAGDIQRERFLEALRNAASKRPLIEVFADYAWEDILPTDVQRGALNSSWLLTGLAIASDIPDLIRDIFEEADDDCPEGFYGLHLYQLGHKVRIIIDDKLPCYPNSGPLFSRGALEDLWVSLVEKAFAKIHGEYAALRGSGYLDEALSDITGQPVTRLHLTDDFESLDELWKKLKKAEISDSLITLITKGESLFGEADFGTVSKETGLIPGHGYCVVRTVETPSGIRLVRLFAPWGEAVWRGRFAAGGAEWTEEVRKATGEIAGLAANDEEEETDGRFWMSLEDIQIHFENLVICWTTDFASAASTNAAGNSLNPGNKSNPIADMSLMHRGIWRFHNVMKRTGKDKPARAVWYYDLSLDAIKTTVFISVQQHAPRLRSNGFAFVHPRIPLCITIALDLGDGKLQIVKEAISGIEQRGLTIDVSIKPGKYKVLIWTPVAKFHSIISDQFENNFTPFSSLTASLPGGVKKLIPAVRKAVEGIFLSHAHSFPSIGLIEAEFSALMSKGGQVTAFFSGKEGWQRAVDQYGTKKSVGGSIRHMVTMDGFVNIFEVIAVLKPEVSLVLLGAWGVDETLADRMRRALGVMFHSFAPMTVSEVPMQSNVIDSLTSNSKLKINSMYL